MLNYGIDKITEIIKISPSLPHIEALPIESFYGVGRATAIKMQAAGIQTGADLKQHSELELVRHFGKVGSFYHRIARGIDERPVNPNRIRKSIGAETSFDPDLEGRTVVEQKLAAIAQDVQQRTERNHAKGRTVTLKVKFANYRQITRSQTQIKFVQDSAQILEIAKCLLRGIEIDTQKVRLLGIMLSNLDTNANQRLSYQLELDLKVFQTAF